MTKEKYITKTWDDVKRDFINPDPRFPEGYLIKSKDVATIFHIVEKSHPYKGYKLHSTLSSGRTCLFLFKRKNFFGL